MTQIVLRGKRERGPGMRRPPPRQHSPTQCRRGRLGAPPAAVGVQAISPPPGARLLAAGHGATRGHSLHPEGESSSPRPLLLLL